MEDIEGYVSKLKVIELKDELKKRSLSTAGVKSVLAQRLQEAMTKEREAEEQTEEAEEETEEEAPMEEAEGEGDTEEEEAPMEDLTESADKEEEPESKMEEEPADSEEAAPQEEKVAQAEDEAEVTQEPSQPTPSQPEPDQPSEPTDTPSQQESEPSADAPKPTPSQEEPVQTTEAPTDAPASTPSTDSHPTPTEPVTAQSSSESVEAPTETTEQAVTASMDTPSQEANTEPEATEVPPVEEKSTEKIEVKPETAPEDASSQQVEQSAKEPEEKMETSASTETVKKAENGPSQEKTESARVGAKRSHDREDSQRTETSKPDPSRAPDPEEPESFDENEVLMESRFKPPEDDSVVTLHMYTSDLYFDIQEDGLGGCGLTEQGFARLWAQTRGSVGVEGGRYYYQVRVEENKDVQLSETEEHPHAIRIGWTVDDTRKGLGEGRGSFGYGSTGKKASNNKFDFYGEPYGPGDVIGCYLDFESSPPTVSYSKNNTSFGTAFTLDESQASKTYYPCITTKNVSFSVNFGGSESWCEVEGVEGFSFIQAAIEDHRVRAPQGPSSPSDCEVIMMVGLPASGKTTWAEKQCERYPGKRYTILGTNLIMERMKVSGLSRKENYRGRFEALIKEATDILNRLFLLAAKNYRNYIIDQTNVYRGAQARKMKYFDGFFHKAEVVVPPHHELRRRTALRNEEMGGPLPDDVINAMKANFYIPKAGDVFQEVSYSDIYGIAAEKIVRQYREDALGLPSYPQSKRGRYDNYRSSGGGGSRYGGHRSSGHSDYSSHSYGSYSPRDHYGYSGGSYGYHHPRPRYSPYGGPPPPPVYGSPRGGGYGQQQYRQPYNSPGQYHGSYGGPPPPRRGGGGGYYGRY